VRQADEQFSTAFVCAIVGIVDSIVAARENGTKYGYPVGPNRELVALGAANLTSSLFVHTGCIPVFGAITRMSHYICLSADDQDHA
jgi:MFS superfamily sulfate permease-like transporter